MKNIEHLFIQALKALEQAKNWAKHTVETVYFWYVLFASYLTRLYEYVGYLISGVFLK